MVHRRLRIALVASLLLLAGCVVAAPPVVHAPPPAPAPHVEVVPASPGPTYVWGAGHWAWRGPRRGYVWVPGHWTVPAQPGYVWVPGHWVARPGGYVWVGGPLARPIDLVPPSPSLGGRRSG